MTARYVQRRHEVTVDGDTYVHGPGWLSDADTAEWCATYRAVNEGREVTVGVHNTERPTDAMMDGRAMTAEERAARGIVEAQRP